MQTFHFRPVHALRPYIDRLWGWESGKDETVALPTVLPGTGAEVFFHYRTPFYRTTEGGSGEPLAHAHLLCVRRKPVALCASSCIGFIAVRFRTGMLHRFTGIPAPELMDHAWPVAELWRTPGKDLAERVACAASTTTRLQLIQHFLLQQLQSGRADPLAEQAVSRIYRECSGISIDLLADDLGIGRRQLERRVKALTGLAPSALRRTGRFQKTVKALMLDRVERPLEQALAHGYYDQAHFIRDFKDFAMTSPQPYLAAAYAKTHFYNISWMPSSIMTAPVNHP